MSDEFKNERISAQMAGRKFNGPRMDGPTLNLARVAKKVDHQVGTLQGSQ